MTVEKKNYKEFKTELIQTISNLSQKDMIVVDSEDRLLIKRADLETTLFLDNAWTRYQNGESMETLAKLMIQPIFSKQSVNLPDLTWEDVKKRVLPQLKNEKFFTEALPQKAGMIYSNNIIPTIGIGYVIDMDDNGMAYITEHMLEKWQIDKDTLHKQVMENIKEKKKDIRPVEAKGLSFFVSDTMDSYDAARMLTLLENPQDFMKDFQGDMMVGVPTRDTLVIFDSKASYVPFFFMQILQDHQTNPYPVSPFVFKWENDRFVPGMIQPIQGKFH